MKHMYKKTIYEKNNDTKPLILSNRSRNITLRFFYFVYFRSHISTPEERMEMRLSANTGKISAKHLKKQVTLKLIREHF